MSSAALFDLRQRLELPERYVLSVGTIQRVAGKGVDQTHGGNGSSYLGRLRRLTAWNAV